MSTPVEYAAAVKRIRELEAALADAVLERNRWRRAEAATVETLQQVQSALGPFEGRTFDVVERARTLAATVERARTLLTDTPHKEHAGTITSAVLREALGGAA